VIPYGKQDISQFDIDSVVEVLKSDFITQGPKTLIFENKISDYCMADYSVTVNSATSALHIACLALGLGEGDWLWTSTNTFVASANCGLYCGAKIDFIDIDPRSYNMSVELLEKKLIYAKKNRKLPKILIPVHFAGQPCDMKKIHKLSKEYGFSIIEDASHSIGGKYLDNPIGNCQYSDITIFSFHPVKIITTAEGGVATTNSKKLSEKMRLYRSHGITKDPSEMVQQPDGDWYYEQVDLGFNYRMTELQSALGISQLRKVDEFVHARWTLKERYDELLINLPLIKPFQYSYAYSSMHLYPVQILTNKLTISHKQIFHYLRKNGVGVGLHYIPVHLQPYYQKFGFKRGDFRNSEAYYSKAISLPLFHAMTFEQQDTVVSVLKKVLQ
jgi:UDP-4-amino-4,6-dideoxy-N-acetyl-beta-L-altrosamine transaminase